MDIIWKDIPGYEGYYEVSNNGNVRSVNRWSVNSLGYWRHLKGAMKAKMKTRCGYLKVILCKDGKDKTIMVHQAVAMAFLGYMGGSKKSTVNHIDGDKTNNQVDNLEVVSMTENRRHAIRMGLWNQRGVNAIKAKLTSEDLRNIRQLYSTHQYTQKQLACMFNVGKSTIGRAVRFQRCD